LINKSFYGVQGRFFQKEPLPAGGYYLVFNLPIEVRNTGQD